MTLDLRACMIGDSYVAGQGDDTGLGWPGRVLSAARTAGADLTLYNLGIRGESGPQIARRLAREVAPRLELGDRRAVVVAYGANDISRGLPLHESVAAAERMLDWVRGEGFDAFLLSPPAKPQDPIWDARAAELTAAMQRLCAERLVAFLNLREAIPDWSLWWEEAAQGDGAHPGGGGYGLIAEAVNRWPAWRAWLGLA